MKALTYHPLFDPYHCAFRTLSFLVFNEGKEYREDVARLIDFYQLFPLELKGFRAPSGLVSRRNKIAANMSSATYAELPSARQLFVELSRVQSITYRYLYAKKVVEKEQFLSGFLLLKPHALDQDLGTSISKYATGNGDLLTFLSALADEPLTGPNGLKARSGLMEHRYDVT